MCDLEWYFLDLTPQQRETVRDECKEAQTRNNKQWTEFLGDGQMTRVEPKEGAHPKDHLVDFLLEYAHPGNAVCLGAASLVGDQGGVGALDNTIAVRKGRFFSQKNDPLVQRMRGLDLREPGMLLLGYEVRMAGKNDWTPEEWGTKPVELHALPNNRLVGQGLMHVQAYPGFVCLTVLTDEADSSLNAMCRVAKKEDLLVDDLLAVVQYDVNTWAFTPPVVAVVRTRSFLCECVCAEGRQFENCHPSDDEVERKDTERLTFHDATDVGVVAPGYLLCRAASFSDLTWPWCAQRCST